MKLVYVVKENDLHLSYKEILKKRLFLSTRIHNRLKKNNQINFFPKIFSINQSVSINSIIEMDLKDEKSNIIPVEGNINIIYEDKFFIAINKPSGVPSHPSKGHLFDSLSNYIEFYLNKQGQTAHIVNRLDKDTSGLVLYAKNSYFHSIISKQFAERKVEKIYIAVVHGIITKKSGFIEKPIRVSADGIKREIHKDGEFALTEFEVLGYIKDLTVLKLRPHTGRTHQLRVHLSSIGHPIVGDNLYNVDYEKYRKLLLHSYLIRYRFDLTNKEYALTAPIPPYFHEYLKVDLNKIHF